MTIDLVKSFVNAKIIPATHANIIVPPRPGYYSIWVDRPDCLPKLFADRLKDDDTLLIYVGIATKDLLNRLVKQDLHHTGPSTFFRGIGSILGCRPPLGSMAHRANPNNYTFSDADNRMIIRWFEDHVSVRIVEAAQASKNDESIAIRRLCPILNDTHNPRRMKELKRLRALCREIASGEKTA